MTRRRIGIVASVIIGGIIALNLLAAGLDRAVGGNEPGGAPASSYATADSGLAAYATLLARFDHDVTHLRGALSRARLNPRATLVVLEPTVLTQEDASTLLDFVVAGGRLVIGGREPFYLRNLRDRPPQWSSIGPGTWTGIDGSLGYIGSIETASEGSFATLGSAHPLVTEGDRTLAGTDRVGAGEIVFLADASPLENAYLSDAGNAAFALALAGDAQRPVMFAEGVHGYGESRGYAAIPTRWKWALAVFGLAAIAFVWSRARRFGPPDRAARELPPARAEYVHALSTTLARTRQPGTALAPMQQWTRQIVAARAGLAVNASDDDLVRAAIALGCSNDEATALVTPITDDEAVRALGRALARVGDDGRARERTP